ncbi:MAG TPA: DMT family transporter [Flavisolibacter sp.]|jgi:drug/metabolite transporter (DMT)-like permease|nr:DMT family transporter [Flavisolibacter sp.]
MNRQKSSNWVLFVLLALVWGSSFILIKKASVHLTGWQVGAIRIFSAGAVFLPFALFYVGKLPKAKIPVIILTGLLGNLFPAFLFAIAIHQKIDSSLAGILNSLTPLFVIVIGGLFFKTRVQSKKIAGVLIGFLGLLLLSISRGPVSINDVGFTLLILLATVMYGINVHIIGTYLKGLDPIKMATVSIGFLTIPTAIVLWLNPVSLSAVETKASILAAVTLGILGSAAATVLFYMLIKKAGGLFASLVTYAIPVVAIAWGLLDGEHISLLQFGCLGIILCGVYLANR